MQQSAYQAFAELFLSACTKCFGETPEAALSESESRYFSDEIQDKTGRVIAWKSLRNYSVAIVEGGEHLNPNLATLDTLARYLADAPDISETARERSRQNYDFWLRYWEQYKSEKHGSTEALRPAPKYHWIRLGLPAAIAALTLILLFLRLTQKTRVAVVEDFKFVSNADLESHGWQLLGATPEFWNKRNEHPGVLTLFTLKGDNWRSSGQQPGIRNLLVQETSSGCFSAELHLSDFFPRENWQQAGILLLEDTSFSGNALRISLAYNDFFGGYTKSGDIIIQALSFHGNDLQHVEEIAHQTLFTLGKDVSEVIIGQNLHNSALRIEKRGRNIRFLYATSPVENFSLRELAACQSEIKPAYVGIFAFKGFVDSSSVVPVKVNFFRLEELDCNEWR